MRDVRSLVAVAMLVSAAVAARPLLAAELAGDGYKLTTGAKGEVVVRGTDGKPLVTLDGYRLAAKGPKTDGGSAQVVSLTGGRQAIEVLYNVSGDDSGMVKVVGRFVPMGKQLHVEYDIRGSAELKIVAGMAGRRAASSAGEQVAKLGTWTRHDGGGIPSEKAGKTLFYYPLPTASVFFAFDKSNKEWADNFSRHCPATQTQPGQFTATYDVVVLPAGTSAQVPASMLTASPLALTVTTNQRYNLYEPSSTPVALATSIANTSEATQNVSRVWWARDFSGTVVAQGNDSKTLSAGEAWNQSLALPAMTKQGMYFVEVAARAGERNWETFTRLNLAALPPYEFKAGADNSIMGLAAYFPLPTEADVRWLLKRIGVKWSRNTRMPADDAKELGLAQNHHSNTPGSKSDAWKDDPAAKEKFIREQLARADERGALYWEFANEWNMREWKIQEQDKGREAARYVHDFLMPIDKLRRETGARVKMMVQGVAGADELFLRNIAKEGGWPLVNAVGLHPGRGNFTVDYLGEKNEISQHGDYWNYYGSVKRFKKLIAELGDKPLFLTEAYSCTWANNWWNDTYRNGAENLLLSYALAKAEGVTAVDWYMLNDSTWFDMGGVRETDREFSFGLMFRDFSPKPGLVAYYTTARALDGATFKGWMQLPGKSKGLIFDTPKGPMAILWDRTDGYFLSKKEGFVGTEPWVDQWKTKTPVQFATAGDEVRVENCIGEESIVKPSNGKVTLTLDGAPRIVWGLKQD